MFLIDIGEVQQRDERMTIIFNVNALGITVDFAGSFNKVLEEDRL